MRLEASFPLAQPQPSCMIFLLSTLALGETGGRMIGGSTMVAARRRKKRPTKESVLSTLVHRAAGLPWQRLQVIEDGCRVFRGEVFEMAEEIKSAAAELKEAFSLPREEVRADWSRARLIADAGGPWSDAC